jgi:hypothetical protein
MLADDVLGSQSFEPAWLKELLQDDKSVMAISNETFLRGAFMTWFSSGQGASCLKRPSLTVSAGLLPGRGEVGIVTNLN